MTKEYDDDTQLELEHSEIEEPVARWLAAFFVALLLAVPLLDWRSERLQKPVRTEVTRFLGQVAKMPVPSWTLGLEGTWFCRSSIEYIGGAGLLVPPPLFQLGKVRSADRNWEGRTDARDAILQFHRDCRRAGVRLLVVPVPEKSELVANKISRRALDHSPGERPINAFTERLLDELRASGVEVLDIAPKPIEPDGRYFLHVDIHWTPAWMEVVARQVADRLQRMVAFEPREPLLASVEELAITADASILEAKLHMLNGVLPPDTAVVRRVTFSGPGAAGRRKPDVILLGDSFCKWYEDAEWGFGASAGFPSHLARFLGRPVDTIAGPIYSPNIARSVLAKRPQPLEGVRAVVWMFGARLVQEMEWGPCPLPDPKRQ